MDQNPVSTDPVVPAPTAPVSDTTAPVSDATTLSAPVADDPIDSAPVVPSTDPTPTPDPTSDTSSSTIVEPTTDATPAEPTVTSDPNTPVEVAKKIAESQNVLIALSGDPSVDELSAAIGLSLFLDKLGKRATAIYSGTTPNALEFLKPEETFESNADTLQDFVIALNKEKADHLRYKLDGEYVKIFITPYKSRISEEDLEFSYGDFNIDLVLALDVANGIDLDAALREHGRIMHDAVIVNITTSNPGRFGEIEWSDKSASSVSEMIAKMLYSTDSKDKIDKEEATAFLTGIIAATNRFSNTKTTPETMQVASDLMQSGADQQLISKNITPDVENELYSILGGNTKKNNDNDPTKLDIEHGVEEKAEDTDDNADIKAETNTDTPESSDEKDQSAALLDDLKAAEASLAQASNEIVPDTTNQPVKLDEMKDDIVNAGIPEPVLPSVSSDLGTPQVDTELSPAPDESFINDKPEKVLQPSNDFAAEPSVEGTEKYSKMLEDAIADIGSEPSPTAEPLINSNPASAMAPQVAANPEINGVPEINYMPMPGEEVLPPPPTPPIDMSDALAESSAVSPEPAAVPAEPEPLTQPITTPQPENPGPDSLGAQPAMQDQVYAPQVADPAAFKIPGV